MANPTIYIVDDDAGVRDSLSLLLGLHGYCMQVFARAQDFLASATPESYGCALIDIRMDGMGGLELQQLLVARRIRLPVIVMTGFANVAAARTAFRGGAVDFLTKPIPEIELLDTIRDAVARCENLGNASAGPTGLSKSLVEKLTKREREVMVLLADGLTSRDVGNRLNITHRTVETYKGRVMEKLNVRRLSDLIKLVTIALTTEEMS